MCNAWNHSPGCDCGWGGGWNGGGWGNGYLGGYRTYKPLNIPFNIPIVWSGYTDDYTRSTKCPRCGAEVYFVRHNGGSVWFDELGWPWPKHACFLDDMVNDSLYAQIINLENGSIVSKSAVVKRQSVTRRLGIIIAIEVRAASVGESERIHYYLLVHCLDDTYVTVQLGGRYKPDDLLGGIAVLSSSDGGFVCTGVRYGDYLGKFQTNRIKNDVAKNW